MNIREQIQTAISDLTDTEKVIILSVIMDVIINLKRLEYLITELREMVDKGMIALKPACELSFLPAKLQKSLWKTIEYDQCTPSHFQAVRMRRLSEEGALTPYSGR